MYSVVLALPSLFVIISAEIVINIAAGNNKSDVRINYSGVDVDIIGDREIELFHLDSFTLKRAVKKKYEVVPRDVFLKGPTPWGDLYKTYNWQEVTRVLEVKSAKLKHSAVKSVVVLSQDFENSVNNPIKVNAGISQTVENTIATTWSRTQETTFSQEIEYNLNVILAKLSGTTSFSYTSTVGKSQEKSESVTVGTTTGMEVELKPGQSVSAVLSANRYNLEVEVVYAVTLRGQVAVNFRKPYKGHHFYGPSIGSILKSGGLDTEVTVVENIQLGLFTDASLRVYDKVTGLPL
ncbi:spherulin-2A-like [Melitaea cinxia]|uniref:spherulin-2A-like n=1 Tax=Melitaea cinxia TaxID=113334 RepID=UPI001E26F8D5|nr:spherulin-2A-like [Melitaea cinxia]